MALSTAGLSSRSRLQARDGSRSNLRPSITLRAILHPIALLPRSHQHRCQHQTALLPSTVLTVIRLTTCHIWPFQLAEWTGGNRVVLRLSEVPHGTPVEGEGFITTGGRADSNSSGPSEGATLYTFNYTDRTGYTESICSTLLMEDDREGEPLNTLDAHPEHSSL